MHFIVIVEGHTEHKAVGEFLRRCLNRGSQLRTQVGVKPINLRGGGADLFKRVAAKAGDYLTGQGADPKIIGVIGLLDLYNPSFDALWPKNKSTKDQRIAWAVDQVSQHVDHPKFRMAFAVHEIEAWMLSQPENLPVFVQQSISKQDLKRMDEPEKVNFTDPPSKLLDRLYAARSHTIYKKTVEGPRLLRALDPERAHQKCPYLARMLDEMLKLAQRAGC